MTKSMHDEKWVKRWLKRTVSITLGVVVGVLINGGVVFAQDTASLEATVRAQQEQINALIKEVNALKNELSTREQVAPKKVRSVEVTPMGVTAPVTGGENTSVALSGVDTITGVGPVTVSTNDRNANISLKNEFTYGNIGMNFNAGEIKTKKLIVDGKSITEQFNELVLPIGINGTGANVKLNGGRLSFNAGDGIGIYGDGEGGMTIASTFKPATRLQIGIDSTGADVDLINGRLHFISENGITMHGGEDVTDAVNYGQLKAVKEELETTTGTLNQGWNYAADNTAAGEEKTIKHGDTLRINGSEAINTSIDNGTENSVKIALKDNFTVNNMTVDTKVGELKFTGKETDTEGHTVHFETLLNSKRITAGGVSLTHSGINAGGNKITGVGKGVADTDAANVGQLKKIKDLVESNKTETDKTENVVANRKLKYGDGVNKHEIKLAEGALLVEGIGPIKTTATEPGEDHDGKIQIGIKDKFTVNNMDVDTIDATLVMETEEGSGTAAKTYNTQLSSKGLDIGDTHVTETGLKVGGVSVGAAGSADDDAANVGQLKATEKIVTGTQSLLNKGWKYAADTVGGGVDNVIKPNGTFTIKGDGNAIKTSSTENGAVSVGLEKKFKVEEFDVDMDGGTLVLGETGSNTIYSSTGVKAGGVSLTHSGIDAGNKKVTNVAKGEAPTDAVNVEQLEENTNLTYAGNKGQGTIKLKDKPLTIKGETEGHANPNM